MKPLHAYPHPERPQNPSPLEMAIYNYELKAKEFHNKRIAQKGPTSEELKNKMARDFNHLQKEKERIRAHARLQTDLKEYRELSASSTVTQLKQEKHHPTQKLARHLAAIGEPKPTKLHEAHHIICGTGQYQSANMLQTRLNLHLHGVGINDPINGVWLINFEKNKEQNWDSPASPPHRKLHRYNYETWINTNFGNAATPKALFLNRLRTVKVKIKTGTVPAGLLEPKNENWKAL
ncbi:AHH domain-containing protein [Pseudoalteromonas sp. NSLLW24]|uniref:AHH domain-containing protein n=1 Tax=Pseudoalteromonas sp. NSLLW24 TaxID=2792050 RepID=UPI0018CC8204|nr:AHH domain-containing protein [Pseudoalteromonas sp. NSLLW24]MBH0001128.1 AHH domain-containing protein [Pseudoalteromonas sp. NSLLW24]